MKSVSPEEVLLFHRKVIAHTGGSSGIRDKGLIASALNRGLATFDGTELFSSIYEKVAAITFSLINNHGFVDGNKRVGVSVMLLLLKLNDIKVKYTQKELIELGLNIADGSWKEPDIYTWIIEHKL